MASYEQAKADIEAKDFALRGSHCEPIIIEGDLA